MDDVAAIRPLCAADVSAAQETAYTALREAGRSYGWEMPEQDDDARQRGRRRLLHCLAHDPDGAYVAEVDSEIVGVGLATRRGRLWFLSLLAVCTPMQRRGIGRRLLDATMATMGDAAAICASDDPKALRRYRMAGFDLVPAYEATGYLARGRSQIVDGVREASYERDRDLVEEVADYQRGAPHGPDLDFFAQSSRPMFVTDTTAGRGYVVCGQSGPAVLGATTADAASRLLWTALLSATDPKLEVSWLTHDQQWAIDVAMSAGLSVRPTGSRCLRGATGPMSPYIPSGVLG